MRHRIVIEADGPFHDPEKDSLRDAWLETQGFRVVRLTNTEIVAEPEKLLLLLSGLIDAPLDIDRIFDEK
jgi:very-short-patch-repair endonuclease